MTLRAALILQESVTNNRGREAFNYFHARWCAFEIFEEDGYTLVEFVLCTLASQEKTRGGH